jgi:hypothetical protein
MSSILYTLCIAPVSVSIEQKASQLKDFSSKTHFIAKNSADRDGSIIIIPACSVPLKLNQMFSEYSYKYK